MSGDSCAQETIPHSEWDKPALLLRKYLVSEDIYYNSPVIFTIEEQDVSKEVGTYTYYIGLNTELVLPEDSPFRQEELLTVGPAIYVRCTETEEIDEAYKLLVQYAESRDWKLEPTYYHVAFDVFDELIIDIYAKVKDGENIEWS